MRRLFAVSLIFLLFFMAGCTQKSNMVQINFSCWGSQSEIKAVKELISEFETKNPDIKVNLIHVPDNYFRKLHLLIISNLTPDVIFLNNLNARLYINAQKLEPLDNYLEQSSVLKKDEFFDNALLAFTHDDELYAIARDISNLVIYYNKDIFDEANVAYPSSDWDYRKFLEIAQKLTKDENNDGHPEVFGFGFEKNSLYWLPFLLSNGGGILANDSNSIILNSDNSKAALQFYTDLPNKYHVAPKQVEQASLTTSQMFLQGKIAMHLCGKWCSLTYKNNADFNWDIQVFPNGNNGSIVSSDASGWAISSSSKYKSEAWRFIEFMASDNSIEKIASEGLILPAKKNIAFSEVFLSFPANSIGFIKALNNAIPTTVSENYHELLDFLNLRFENLFNGTVSVEDIVNERFVQELDKIISEKNAVND